MMKKANLRWIAALLFLAGGINARSQWVTQSFPLKAGWNAVYLHVDASYSTLDALVGADLNNPIREVWLWNPPAATLQFVQNPQQPVGGGTQWSSWDRSGATPSNLQRLIGNAAYLVRVDASTPTYTWSLKGKPVAPKYEWTSTGLNFLGFPTPAGAAPNFESFLAPAPALQQSAEIFRYVGGPFGANNPQRVLALRSTPVNRGEAFWIRSGDTFNRYFGPFEVQIATGTGIQFQDSLGQSRLRLRNLTAAPLTISLQLVNSETPPGGEMAIAGPPPVLVRGPINITNLTYGSSVLSTGPQSWTLAPGGLPGSETEVVLGVNRSLMTAAPGSLYAGVLRFTDSLSLEQADVPVSATSSSTAGLWVGEASVSQVRHYLRAYEKDSTGALTLSPDGKYIASSTNTTLGEVARPYPLRLIVHHGTNGMSVLLQRLYVGLDLGSNTVLTTRETLLDPGALGSARRISAAHLPFSAANAPWPMMGEFRLGSNLTTVVNLDYDDQASNPFVHTYHPDHDNLNATFDQKLPVGTESYSVSRQIKLSFAPPNDDFQSLTTSGYTLTGQYDETMTINSKPGEFRSFDARGSFSLNRISTIPVLTQ